MELNKLLAIEEDMWHQRLRSDWANRVIKIYDISMRRHQVEEGRIQS